MSKSGQVKANSFWSQGICPAGAIEPVIHFLADCESVNLMRHFSVLSLPAEGKRIMFILIPTVHFSVVWS